MLSVGANSNSVGFSGATLTRTGAVYAITAGTLSGGVFGGTFIPPTVTGLAPTSGPEAGGNNVVITGTGFTGTTGPTSVQFGATNATSYVVDSDTQITAVAPAGTGTVDVTVTNNSATSATSANSQYTYLAALTVTALSPTSGPAAGTNPVVIIGTGFTGTTGAASVQFGSTNATNYVVDSDTQITAVAPAGTGTVDVTVTNNSAMSATSANSQYAYLAAPTVTGLSPASGPEAGTNSVVITGTGFTGTTGAVSVQFGTTNATSYVVDSDTQITAVAPAGTGTVDVTVTNNSAMSATSANSQYAYLSDTTRTRTQRVIANFLSRRSDQITAADPELTGRLTQRGAVSEGPISLTGQGTLDNNRFAFATSLRQIMASGDVQKHKKRAQLGDMMALGTQSLAGPVPSYGFDIWVKGQWSQARSDSATSNLGLLYVGADYQLSQDLVIGLMGQFDWADEKDTDKSISVDGKGWLIGPYIAARIHQNLIFDGRLAWGQSENDVSPFNTYTDTFDTTRWLARGTLTGSFNYDAWHFAPHIGVLFFEEHQKAYTDSMNVRIPWQSVSLGRMTFGPRVSYRFKGADGTTIEPSLSIKGIWDFDTAPIVDIDTGAATETTDIRARAQASLSARFNNGWSVAGEGFYDGIGANDFEAYGGSIKLTMPLN